MQINTSLLFSNFLCIFAVCKITFPLGFKFQHFLKWIKLFKQTFMLKCRIFCLFFFMFYFWYGFIYVLFPSMPNVWLQTGHAGSSINCSLFLLSWLFWCLRASTFSVSPSYLLLQKAISLMIALKDTLRMYLNCYLSLIYIYYYIWTKS